MLEPTDSRVIHDSSEVVHWPTILGDSKINCVVTDPPFGIGYKTYRVTSEAKAEYSKGVDNDGDLVGALEVFYRAFENMAPHLAENVDLYIFTAWNVYPQWVEFLESQIAPMFGLTYKMLLIWDKQNLGLGDIDGSWNASHELIMYCKIGRRDMNKQRSSVLSFDRVPAAQRIHSMEKPLGLLEELIKVSTDPGDIVVDLFAGSGSTIHAAKNCGRVGLGVELDIKYIEQANARLREGVLF